MWDRHRASKRWFYKRVIQQIIVPSMICPIWLRRTLLHNLFLIAPHIYYNDQRYCERVTRLCTGSRETCTVVPQQWCCRPINGVHTAVGRTCVMCKYHM